MMTDNWVDNKRNLMLFSGRAHPELGVAVAKVLGDGCADDPEDWCLAIGDMADYCVETGKGHYITYDEVIDIG